MSQQLTPAQFGEIVRKMRNENREVLRQYDQITKQYEALAAQMNSRPRSTDEEIDAIPGRRVDYELVGRHSFTLANNGKRMPPIKLTVSQDGPFIQTAYIMAIWRPNAPNDATLFGRWRPVYSWPLPAQEVDGDSIDISYEMSDAGSMRELQTERRPPLFSRPDLILPLSKPMLFAPDSITNVTITYESINFAPGDEGYQPTTGGELVVAIPGYKIVNM